MRPRQVVVADIIERLIEVQPDEPLLRDMFICPFDRLQVLKRMTQGSWGQSMQPLYRKADWQPITFEALKQGILVQKTVMLCTERGRMQSLTWFEPGEDFRYDPLPQAEDQS